MQFISNSYAIYFQFLCNLVSNFYATYLQFLYNSLVKKYVLSKVNFDGTLKKANRVCSLTLSLCCVRDPCFTFIQFGAHRLLHFESFLYKVPKTKAEAGNSTLSYAMVFNYLNSKIHEFIFKNLRIFQPF